MGSLSSPPAAERPDTPGPDYGVPATGGTMVDWSHVVERLTSAEAYWVVTVTPRNRPHAVPIWGVYVDDELYLEVGAPETAKNRNIASNPAISVHLDGANDVVIVNGTAEPTRPDHDLGIALAAAFKAKYRDYQPGPTDWDGGGLVRVVPESVLAWTDMSTATRWRFATERARP
jgi:nitroimidazol reductase NimA-like FMN-containing flavoprotein (pyridoxamine 5'-phosphate oxidase superfamily)